MGTAAWRAAIALACSLPYGDDPMWEYQVVEEPNPVALQERLRRIARDGREERSISWCAAEVRLLALVRRQVTVSGERSDDMQRPTQNG